MTKNKEESGKMRKKKKEKKTVMWKVRNGCTKGVCRSRIKRKYGKIGNGGFRC